MAEIAGPESCFVSPVTGTATEVEVSAAGTPAGAAATGTDASAAGGAVVDADLPHPTSASSAMPPHNPGFFPMLILRMMSRLQLMVTVIL
jgi:hypothetical protein